MLNRLNDEPKIDSWRVRIIFISALALLTLICYSPALRADFTNWDDNSYVYENLLLRNFSISNIITIFSSFHVSGNYHPLTLLTYLFEYAIFGKNPAVYHFVNIIIHIANAVLVWILFGRLAGYGLARFIIALLFCFHPLRVESVAWISERKDLLCAFFYLLSMIVYLEYIKNKSVRYIMFCFVFFILSLLSKSMSVTLPVVLLLLDYLKGRHITYRLVLEKAPFFVVAIIFMIISIAGQRQSGALTEAFSSGVLARVLLISQSAMQNIYKTFLPINLSCFYPMPSVDNEIFTMKYYFSAALFLIMIIAALFFIKKKKVISFGLLFYMITILPVIQIISFGAAITADRYSYIPVLGIVFILAVYIEKFIKNTEKPKTAATAIYIIIIAIIVSLAGISFARAHVWQSSLSLWNDAIIKYPDVPILLNNRGSYFLSKNEYSAAIGDFKRALNKYPKNIKANFNLGYAFLKMKDYDAADVSLQNVLTHDPDNSAALNALGNVYLGRNDPEKAKEYFQKAALANPKQSEAYINLGALYAKENETMDAIKMAEKAIKVDKTSWEAHYLKARIYVSKKQYDEALNELDTAVDINPEAYILYRLRGNLYDEKNTPEKALQDFDAAIKYGDGSSEIFHLRSVSYLRLNRFSEAARDCKKAIDLNPDFENAYMNLAVAYFYMGDYEKSMATIDIMSAKGFIVDENFLRDLKSKMQK